jgi:hypothetical protein
MQNSASGLSFPATRAATASTLRWSRSKSPLSREKKPDFRPEKTLSMG